MSWNLHDRMLGTELPVSGYDKGAAASAPVCGMTSEPRCGCQIAYNELSIEKGKEEKTLPPVEALAAPEKA